MNQKFLKWGPLGLSALLVFAIVLFGGGSLKNGNSFGITGFATYESPKISEVFATLTTSKDQILPEDSKIEIIIGKQSKVFLAKEFISLSGEKFERVQLLGDEGFGYTGNYEYVINLDKLGFTDDALSDKANIPFEIKITYKNLVLRNDKNVILSN